MTITEKTEILERSERRHGAKAWAALGVAALMFTAACSDEGGNGGGQEGGEGGGQQNGQPAEEPQEDPKETLREALKDQESWKEQKVSMGVEATEEQTQKILDVIAEDGGMSEADRQSAEDALELIRESSMVVEARSTTDTPLADMEDLTGADWSFTADMGEGRAIQIMEVGESEYFLRADILEIMRSLGPEGESQAEQLRASFQDVPAEQQWLVEALEGSWMALDKQLGTDFDRSVSQEVQRLEDEAGDQKPVDFILDYADVEKEDDSTYVVNLKVKEMLKDNPEILETADNTSASGASSSESSTADSSADVQEQLDAFNDNTFPITYTVEDGKVTAMEMDVMDVLDVIQPPDDAEANEVEMFEKLKETEMPVASQMSDAADTLEVPSDAVPLSESDLEAVFGMQTAPGSDSGSGSGSGSGSTGSGSGSDSGSGIDF